MNPNFPPVGYIPVDSALDGILVYKPAPKKIDDQREVVDFNCPQCGANIAYSVEDGGLTCSHCGYYEPPKEKAVGKRAEQMEFTTETIAQAARGWGEARKELECQNCGALTSIPVDSLTHTCAFCGSNKVIQRNASQDLLRPRFLIPFRVTSESCPSITQQWLGSSWMTPAGLAKLTSVQAYTAVYIPFWTFSAVTLADWKAEVGHQETERYYDAGDKQWKTRIVTVWRWESGRVRLPIQNLLVGGTSKLSELILNQIKNFDLTELVPYEAEYLAGFQARAYDVPLEAGWEKGRAEMREETRKACRSQTSTSQIRNFSMNLDFSDETWRYILLPVQVAAYNYEGKLFQIMINGQTGTIAGQRPVDWIKVWLVIGALLVPGLFLGLIGLATLPLGGAGLIIAGLGFVLLIVGVVIAFVIGSKAQHLDDA